VILHRGMDRDGARPSQNRCVVAIPRSSSDDPTPRLAKRARHSASPHDDLQDVCIGRVGPCGSAPSQGTSRLWARDLGDAGSETAENRVPKHVPNSADLTRTSLTDPRPKPASSPPNPRAKEALVGDVPTLTVAEYGASPWRRANNPSNFTATLNADRVTIVANPLGCYSPAGAGQTSADWSSLPANGDSSSGAGCTRHARTSSLVSASAAPAAAATTQDVTFTATASDPDPGDSPLTYSTVTVTDPSGVTAGAAAMVTVTAPSSQPAAELTPPSVTLLAAALRPAPTRPPSCTGKTTLRR
jgi:hypothetical protein